MDSVTGLFSSLSFGTPAVLLALLALPAIYFLLRITPPPPRPVRFPPFRLMLGLQSPVETPARTPWWIFLLRLVAVALTIVALAGPRIDTSPPLDIGTGPLVLLVDNGWPAAHGWATRQTVLGRILEDAEQKNRPVILAATAETGANTPGLLDPARARLAAEALVPRPWLPDRARTVAALETMRFFARPHILWLSDGVDMGNDSAIAARLARLGTLSVFADAPGQSPLALLPPKNQQAGFSLSLARARSETARQGLVEALDSHGDRLEEAPFSFARGQSETSVSLQMPTKLRDETARLIITGENSAGATQLLDGFSQRRTVGVVSGSAADTQQPLLADSFYLDRALSPYAELRQGSIKDMLASHVDILILADVGQVSDEDRARILHFLDQGGMLLRFAGPRLAERASEIAEAPLDANGQVPSDDLLPVRLRGGERQLGSAMIWAKPQTLASFPAGSPFQSLTIPADVTVSRQLLAEPSVELAEHSWATLADGTPLVTASAHGSGEIVLFHIDANPNWSSLPLSGLFVDMLRQLLARAGHNAGGTPESGVYAPYRSLDGFGVLGAPLPEALPLNIASPARATDSAHPPGLYGSESGFVALNAVGANTSMRALQTGGHTAAYSGGAMRDLTGMLLVAALLLLFVDAAISLFLRGAFGDGTRLRLMRRGAPLAILLVLTPCLVRADESKDMQAALTARLAYVVTGDAQTDAMSRAGLDGLDRALLSRTSFEPDKPVGVNMGTDDLALYPLLYWPVLSSQKDLSPNEVARINDFMRNGGMILFDTRDGTLGMGAPSVAAGRLRHVLSQLDIPALQPVPADHVLTKSFYLLRDFPGRWQGGQVWVEAIAPADSGQVAPARGGDGVSPVIIGSNDWAAAWAIDDSGQPLAAVTPGGDRQREAAIRFGVNVVMYALTGNYKTDQIHAPAILQRLGE